VKPTRAASSAVVRPRSWRRRRIRAPFGFGMVQTFTDRRIAGQVGWTCSYGALLVCNRVNSAKLCVNLRD
jgi:hypothetical protein